MGLPPRVVAVLVPVVAVLVAVARVVAAPGWGPVVPVAVRRPVVVAAVVVAAVEPEPRVLLGAVGNSAEDASPRSSVAKSSTRWKRQPLVAYASGPVTARRFGCAEAPR